MPPYTKTKREFAQTILDARKEYPAVGRLKSMNMNDWYESGIQDKMYRALQLEEAASDNPTKITARSDVQSEQTLPSTVVGQLQKYNRELSKAVIPKAVPDYEVTPKQSNFASVLGNMLASPEAQQFLGTLAAGMGRPTGVGAMLGAQVAKNAADEMLANEYNSYMGELMAGRVPRRTSLSPQLQAQARAEVRQQKSFETPQQQREAQKDLMESETEEKKKLMNYDTMLKDGIMTTEQKYELERIDRRFEAQGKVDKELAEAKAKYDVSIAEAKGKADITTATGKWHFDVLKSYLKSIPGLNPEATEDERAAHAFQLLTSKLPEASDALTVQAKESFAWLITNGYFGEDVVDPTKVIQKVSTGDKKDTYNLVNKFEGITGSLWGNE